MLDSLIPVDQNRMLCPISLSGKSFGVYIFYSLAPWHYCSVSNALFQPKPKAPSSEVFWISAFFVHQVDRHVIKTIINVDLAIMMIIKMLWVVFSRKDRNKKTPRRRGESLVHYRGSPLLRWVHPAKAIPSYFCIEITFWKVRLQFKCKTFDIQIKILLDAIWHLI